MGLVNKILKWGSIGLICCYASSYLVLSGYAIYDFKKSHYKTVKEKSKNVLTIKNYEFLLEGKVKHLTIVGEIHLYNYKESNFAKKLVSNYENVAREGSDNKNLDFLTKTSSFLFTPSLWFYSIGSGRYITNKTTYHWALHEGKKIYDLEKGKDSFANNLNLAQKITFLGLSCVAMATAPATYFEGKNELLNGDKPELSEGSLVYYAGNISERDMIMTNNIIGILKKGDVDSLLCIVGIAHVEGIEKKLMERVKRMKINIYEPKNDSIQNNQDNLKTPEEINQIYNKLHDDRDKKIIKFMVNLVIDSNDDGQVDQEGYQKLFEKLGLTYEKDWKFDDFKRKINDYIGDIDPNIKYSKIRNACMPILSEKDWEELLLYTNKVCDDFKRKVNDLY